MMAPPMQRLQYLQNMHRKMPGSKSSPGKTVGDARLGRVSLKPFISGTMQSTRMNMIFFIRSIPI